MRYMATAGSRGGARKKVKSLNVKRIISIIFSFEVISSLRGTSFYHAPNRSRDYLFPTVVFHFVGILTLFPNKLHIGDYLEDKIFYCPIGINLLIGIEPG